MNETALQKKLISVARANPPSNHVPYAFEKRIMARLASLPGLDLGALWARALWHAVVPCAAVALLLGLWTFFTPLTNPAPESNPTPTNLSQDLENTLMVAVDHLTDYGW
jgi:hypothetical protein